MTFMQRGALVSTRRKAFNIFAHIRVQLVTFFVSCLACLSVYIRRKLSYGDGQHVCGRVLKYGQPSLVLVKKRRTSFDSPLPQAMMVPPKLL